MPIMVPRPEFTEPGSYRITDMVDTLAYPIMALTLPDSTRAGAAAAQRLNQNAHAEPSSPSVDHIHRGMRGRYLA